MNPARVAAFDLIASAAVALWTFDDPEAEGEPADDVKELHWARAQIALIAAGVIERHPRGGWRRVPAGKPALHIDASLRAVAPRLPKPERTCLS